MNQSFQWETTEYAHQERSKDWFWAMGIIAGAAALASFFFGNILLALIILIGTFTLMLLTSKKPEVLQITVTNKGIKIKNDLFPFASLSTFWIDEESSYPTLTIPTGKILMPHIRLGLEGVNPLELQNFLLLYMKEEYQEPTGIEALVHYFGF